MSRIRPLDPTSIEDPSQFATADLRNRIGTGKFKEGLNIVEIDDDQVALTAKVENGRIAGYVFIDSSGAEIPGTVLRKQSRPGVPVEECFICRRRGDTITCKQIPCP